MRLGLAVAMAACALPSAVAAETVNNRSVVALHAAGIDDETVIAKIRSSETNFDLTTEALIALKKQGVSSSVIGAMVATSSSQKGEPLQETRSRSSGMPAGGNVIAASRPAGIYLNQNGQLVRIDPNVSGETKTGGFFGSAMTMGIAKISIKIVIQGENARVRTSEHTPQFFFYLPASANRASASSFDEQTGTNPTSPNEFSLIRLEKKSGSREARIARGNFTGFQSGVVSKDRINTSYEEARPGVFSVRPSAPLAPGEYSFVSIGSGGAKVARLFDFSVM